MDGQGSERRRVHAAAGKRAGRREQGTRRCRRGGAGIASLARARSQAGSGHALMAGERILVVDDNAVNKKLASFVLMTQRYEVRGARNAEEALDVLQQWMPRVILMDVQLPGMDGLTLTRQLKADPRTRDIIIIALTAYAMKGDEGKARDAGCDAYVTKPIDTRALPLTIAALLRASPGAA